jgi:protein involved in polysaccharide export with SLBB domain
MNDQSSHLPIHEWLIVLLFCILLCVLGGLAYGHRSDSITGSTAYQQLQMSSILSIKVEGAVAKPGTYQLPIGSLLIDAVTLAEPLDEADLTILKTNRPLQEHQTLIIPQKKWITIYIEGAVNTPGPLEVVSGTRYEDLLDLVDFLPTADQRSLRKKKRLLREGETVQISFRQLPTKKPKKSNPKKFIL